MSCQGPRPRLPLPAFVPYTKLTERYVTLKGKNSAHRLEEARSTTSGELADEFKASALAFSEFFTDHKFFPGGESRDKGKNAKSWKRTYGWAMSMRNTGPPVKVAGESGLDFAYVSREIVPTRTKPAVPFAPAACLTSKRETGTHKVSVDLILANASARPGRPIVAELKIAADKDPFTGLVQALAAAAQLVSPSQRCRLSNLAAASQAPVAFASFEEDQRIDVYVVLAEFPKTGRDRFKQLERAVDIAGELERHDGMCEYLGRIRVVTMERVGYEGPDEPGTVRASEDLPKPRSPGA